MHARALREGPHGVKFTLTLSFATDVFWGANGGLDAWSAGAGHAYSGTPEVGDDGASGRNPKIV